MDQDQSSKQRVREWRDNNFVHTSDSPHGPMNHSLTLHLLNGNKVTFYYLYLVKVEFFLTEDGNSLILHFTSDIVTLHGYRLEKLHAEFLGIKPTNIYVYDRRYNVITSDEPIVIDVIVNEK